MKNSRSKRRREELPAAETIRPEEIRLGAWVSFVPTNYEYEPDPERPTHKLVVRQKGRIVQINAAHRWFQIEAEIGGRLYRECFKF